MVLLDYRDLEDLLDRYTEQDRLPPVHKKLADWITHDRPLVAGKVRTFRLEPFYHEIINDDHPNIQCVQGRQTYKTTTSSDIIGWLSTSQPNCEVGYVVDNEARRLAFSKQRLRNETFLQNPKLRAYLKHDKANVGVISLINGSNIYLANDEGGYKNIEGRSLAGLIFDEWQYHDRIDSMQKAFYTLFRTHGRFWGFGIGGEAGSEYHKKWSQTDQREWVYDSHDVYQGWEGQSWRKKLKFDEKGQIINTDEELAVILKGKWVAMAPENIEFRGYHLPQAMFAAIPLTIKDAVEKYKISPIFSVEWQKTHAPASIYQAHVMGEFYKAERRPITPQMMYACMHPYRHLALMQPHEVVEMKMQRGNEIRVIAGIDWGSGPAASHTVVTIMIRDKIHNTYRIAWIEKRPQEHQLDQARYMVQLLNMYQVDAGVGDLGYGAIQVKFMQEGGTDSRGVKVEGLGKRKFIGCRTIGDETKPHMDYRTEQDEHGTQTGRLQIDKTTTIQKFVDFIAWYTEHPDFIDGTKTRPRLIIPFKIEHETDWMVDDFCSLTRKDLEIEQDIVVEDPRQKARKEFNHPRDSLMSCIYCLVADENHQDEAYRILGVRKRI